MKFEFEDVFINKYGKNKKYQILDMNFNFLTNSKSESLFIEEDERNLWKQFWLTKGEILKPDKHNPLVKNEYLKTYIMNFWQDIKLPCGKILRLEQLDNGNFIYKDENIELAAIKLFNPDTNEKTSFNNFPIDIFKIKEKFDEERYIQIVERYAKLTFTMGNIMLLPVSLKKEKRFDLFLEQIRLFYENKNDSSNLIENKNFFDLFVDFKGFIDFFMLNDLVQGNYDSEISIIDDNNLIKNWEDWHNSTAFIIMERNKRFRQSQIEKCLKENI